MFQVWWQKRVRQKYGLWRRQCRRASRGRAKSRPLCLDALEDRTLLSTFTVDRLTDTGQGMDLAGDLRYCITQATSGNDTILFRVTGTINLSRVLPTLTTSLSIEGPGASNLTVRRDTGGDYRIFTVAASTTVSMSGLTIANGRAYRGGGILNEGSLTVTDSTLAGNTAVSNEFLPRGGAIANFGTLTVSNSTLTGNSAVSGGGGIANSGSLTVNNSTLAGNSAAFGGGIHNDGGTVTVGSTTITGNFAIFDGGGIFNEGGTLILSNSTLANNSASPGGIGGGVYNDVNGTLTGIDCTFAGNAADFGAGIYNYYGGTTISNSTFVSNSARVSGGGIANYWGLTLNNCTLSGNTAGISGGGILNSWYVTSRINNCTLSGNITAGHGGGILNGGVLIVSNSTVSGNSASGPETAGGIDNRSSSQVDAPDATVQLLNSTISDNMVTSADRTGSQLFCGQLGNHRAVVRFRNTILSGNGNRPISFASGGGVFTSQGHNLSSDDSGNLTEAGDLPNTDPRLGPLQDNGGPTQTMGLLAGSPAIDAGDNTGAPDFDQRGQPRIVGGVIDIGAYEVQNFVVTTTSNGGPGSLRDALDQANRAGGSLVTFGVGGTINLDSALPEVSRSVEVRGPRDTSLTLRRSTGGVYPIFKVDSGTTVLLSGLTITNGLGGTGGGILNAGTLTLSNSTLSGNSADFGGGILNTGILTVSACTFTGNGAFSRFDQGSGGGIDNRGRSVVKDSTFSGNIAGPGGGIANSGTMIVNNCSFSANAGRGTGKGGDIFNSGTLNISNSTLSGSSAYGGGSIANQGTLTVSNSTLSGNSAILWGGGLSNDGTLTIDSCALSGNLATGNGNNPALGGGIYNNGDMTVSYTTLSGNRAVSGNLGSGGGGIYNNGAMTVSYTTLSGNRADGGGGIVNYSAAVLTVTNSTLSDNSAIQAGGIGNVGMLTIINSTITGNIARGNETAGGIANIALLPADTTVQLLNCTISNNTNSGSFHVGSQLYSSTGHAIVRLRNTIVAGSGDKPNCFGIGFVSEGHNLSSDGSGNLIGPGDLRNTDPRLGPLQDNGGPTLTLALLPGSPAVDAGDNAGAADWDQRGPGFPRIVGGTIDIGAFEVQLGPATHFGLGAPAHVTSNTPFDVTVTALDAYGHTAVGYTGTVTFTSTDPDAGVVLPTDYAFTVGDNGVHSFPGGFTLVTVGDQTLTATDTVDNSISGRATVTVDPGPSAPPAGGPAGLGRPASLLADHCRFDAAAISVTPTPVRTQGLRPNLELASLDRLFGSLNREACWFLRVDAIGKLRWACGQLPMIGDLLP